MIFVFFFFSSRRRHTRYWRDWSSDVCSSDLFALDLQHKDARLAMELAADVGAPVLIGALVQQLRQIAKSRGLGRWDTTAIATVYEELAGTEIGRAHV